LENNIDQTNLLLEVCHINCRKILPQAVQLPKDKKKGEIFFRVCSAAINMRDEVTINNTVFFM